LFGQKGTTAQKVDKEKAEVFHTTTEQGLILTQPARPDIITCIAYICTKVEERETDDWEKLLC